MKKILILFFLMFFMIPLSSCNNLHKYKNEVSYFEFMEKFKEELQDSIIRKNMNFDFTYTMEAIEKYKDDDSVNINSILQHDNALSFAKWKDITNDVEQYIYVYEKDEIVTIYNADKDLNNIQQNGTNYSFEYYIKYNVTKVFNYNFLPDDYKCYIDYKDNLIIYTFIYNKENVGTETIQYCFSDELVSKMTVIENLEKNLIEGQLTYKKEFHEFKLIDNDLYKDYAKIFNIS